MKVNASTEEEFFKACGEREGDIRKLDKLIRNAAPSLKPQLHNGMSITMLGYGMFHYKTKSGREGDWPAIAIAPQKKYMSLYICALNKDGEYLAEANKDSLGNVSCGKSCVRFKDFDDINKNTLTKILSNIEKRVNKGEDLFSL